MATRIEWHTKVSGPERFVDTRKVEIHASKRFNCVVIWLDFHVSHLAQPEVHSLSSPVSRITVEAAVSSDEHTKRSFIGRYITIIH